jgi:hypothetical protein
VGERAPETSDPLISGGRGCGERDEAAADEALHGEERVLGVHHALALGDLW